MKHRVRCTLAALALSATALTIGAVLQDLVSPQDTTWGAPDTSTDTTWGTPPTTGAGAVTPPGTTRG